MKNDNMAVSSRVRLARNAAETPFPSHMSAEQRGELWANVCGCLPESYSKLQIEASNRLEAMSLAEQHWISPEFAGGDAAHGVILNRSAGVSVMVNEEDHLRIQTLKPGLALDSALAACLEVEQELDKAIPFAFDEKLGYLTSCPTNLGTALRVSTMLHLPALTESRNMRHIVNAVTKLGLTVRGFYGEGSEAWGGYYQISNQVTLGLSEEEIVKRLLHTVNGIIVKERATRAAMRGGNPGAWDDHVWRAYGLLTHARLLSFEEAVNQLSLIRMGILEGIIPNVTTERIDKLTSQIGSATLAFESGEELKSQQLDEFRAHRVRKGLMPHLKE